MPSDLVSRNQIFKDPPLLQRKTAFLVQSSINQVIALGTNAVVAFNVEPLDSGNNFDLATETYTVPLTGVYSFTANLVCTFTNAASPSRTLMTLENGAGTELYRGTDIHWYGHGAGAIFTMQLQVIAPFSQGELLRLRAFSVSGSEFTIQAGITRTRWSGYRIESESRTIL